MIDTVQEINRATGDPIAKDRMAKTLLLRNKLDFTGFVGYCVFLFHSPTNILLG